MSLEVRTSGSNSIVTGTTNNYLKIGENMPFEEESLIITCSKLNRIYTGSLYAFVNDEPANKTVCLEYDYSPMHADDDPRFCLKQQFIFKFELSKTIDHFDVLCRFVDTADLTDRVSLTLYKLCKL